MTRQLEALAALRFGGTMRYVADKIGCSRPAASAAICRLSKAGMVRREFLGVRHLYRLTATGRAELSRNAKGAT